MVLLLTFGSTWSASHSEASHHGGPRGRLSLAGSEEAGAKDWPHDERCLAAVGGQLQRVGAEGEAPGQQLLPVSLAVALSVRGQVPKRLEAIGGARSAGDRLRGLTRSLRLWRSEPLRLDDRRGPRPEAQPRARQAEQPEAHAHAVGRDLGELPLGPLGLPAAPDIDIAAAPVCCGPAAAPVWAPPVGPRADRGLPPADAVEVRQPAHLCGHPPHVLLAKRRQER
mmetsp:Transcript_102386/g.270448  ORF Transcript_102386/g.270448 Transcript_102386/m.270448 type:complete len:225 (-) Transcript_102386:108-782(-)